MRIVWVVLGLLMAGGALFVIVEEQLTGASEGAVVNARLTTIASPIAGELDLAERPLGATLSAGDTLGRVTNPLVDETRLSDLTLQRSIEEAELVRLDAEIEAVTRTRDTLRSRAGRYLDERNRQLEAEIEAIGARRAAAQARLAAATSALSRAERLSQRGVAATATLDDARADAEVAQRRVDEIAGEARVRTVRLAAARNGVFLSDSNDAPYSEREAKTLDLRRRTLLARRSEAEAGIRSLTRRIDAEKRRIAAIRHARLTANVDGRLWEVLAARGERVQIGQAVARLLDCQSTIVTVSVTEATYNRLSVGDPVRFRLNGEAGHVFTGSIARLAGIGADALYRNLAVPPTQKHIRRYDVALLVPELRAHDELGCAIGRTGRAYFEDLPLEWLRTIAATLAPS